VQAKVFTLLVELGTLALSAWILTSESERELYAAQAWRATAKLAYGIGEAAGKIGLQAEQRSYAKVAGNG